MQDQHPSTCWALLIGVNLYPNKPPYIEPLAGAVNDVDRIAEVLQQVPNVVLTVLKASTGNSTNPELPLESSDIWPTVDNVRLHLDRIANTARPNDRVYIHFSGHGMRRDTKSSKFNDEEDDDDEHLAFLLYDKVSGVQALQGLVLAERLKHMVEVKQLKPVLVLDCCYSGAVLRGGDGSGAVREAMYNAAFYPAHDRQHLRKEVSSQRNRRRDAESLPDWFIDPAGYAILTACAPWERTFEVGPMSSRMGPLTRVFHPALLSMKSRRRTISVQALHSYILVQFHKSLVSLSPRRYGNPDICLLDVCEVVTNALAKRIRVGNVPARQGNITTTETIREYILEDGEVSGIIAGDEYHLQSTWTTTSEPESKFKFRIKTLGSFQSILEPTDLNIDMSPIKTGWCAIPGKPLSKRLIGVVLSSGLAPELWRNQIKDSKYVEHIEAIDHSFRPSCVHVGIIDGYFRVTNGHGQDIHGLASFPVADPSAIKNTINQLDHLSKFKCIETITNSLHNPDFEDSIDIRLDCNGEQIGVNEVSVNTKHLDLLSIRCINQSRNQRVFFWVFWLTETKKIFNPCAAHSEEKRKESKYGRYRTIESGSPKDINRVKPLSLRLRVPENRDTSDDILKVFVTDKEISLDSLELPAISNITKESQIEVQQRGHNLDEFMEILSDLSTTARASGGSLAKGDWFTRDFLVHISR
jgi:hypothetical protein